LKIYLEHSDAILSLIFSSCDTNFILSGSRDQSLHIWNIEQHTQSPDQPIPINIIEDEEETSSNSGNKKRHNKPRPNRAEREKKRAAKVNENQDDRLVSSTNRTMNECKEYLFERNYRYQLFFLCSKLFSISFIMAIGN